MIFLLYTTSVIDYLCETPFVAPFVAPHFTRKKRGHRYLGIAQVRHIFYENGHVFLNPSILKSVVKTEMIHI
jgi:hypothetical protein